MALIHSFEKSGNHLFRNRSYFPILLYVFAVPVVYLTNYNNIPENVSLILTIISISFSVIGFIIRAISIGTTPKGTSGRNTKEGQVAQSLNTKGIYSVIRHPLYLGNYLMWAGIVLFTFNLYFFIIVSLGFWLYYERIMYAEERFLERKFGKDYLDWSMEVPAFLPSFKIYKKGEIRFSLLSVLRREYSGFLATVISFAFIDQLRFYFEYGQFDWYRPSAYAVLIAAIITLILRTLKHNTKVLNEDNRS